MLTVKRIDKADAIIFKLSGHAGSTADGVSVCNMASTIFYMGYNVIKSIPELGTASIAVQGADWLDLKRSGEAEACAYCLEIGFRMLSDRFPENIEVVTQDLREETKHE